MHKRYTRLRVPSDVGDSLGTVMTVLMPESNSCIVWWLEGILRYLVIWKPLIIAAVDSASQGSCKFWSSLARNTLLGFSLTKIQQALDWGLRGETFSLKSRIQLQSVLAGKIPRHVLHPDFCKRCQTFRGFLCNQLQLLTARRPIFQVVSEWPYHAWKLPSYHAQFSMMLISFLPSPLV